MSLERAETTSIFEVFEDLDTVTHTAYQEGEPYQLDLNGVRPRIRIDSFDSFEPAQIHEYSVLSRKVPRFVGEVAVERLVWSMRRPFKNPTPYLVIPGEATHIGEALRYGHRLPNYEGKILNAMFEHFELPYRFAGFISQDGLYIEPGSTPNLRIIR